MIRIQIAFSALPAANRKMRKIAPTARRDSETRASWQQPTGSLASGRLEIYGQTVYAKQNEWRCRARGV